MKFLLDVCALSRSLRATLTDLGYDVISGLEIDPRASDEVLPWTCKPRRTRAHH